MADLSTTLDNILHHWKMEESSGARTDEIGTANLTANGTGGIPSATGKQGNGADLERGDTDYFSKTSYSAPNSDFSFSFWVNFESLPSAGGYQQIIFKWGAVGSRCWNPYIQESGGNFLITYDYRSVTNQSTSGTATVSLSTGTWYHIVMAHDISAASCAIYLNGVSQTVTPSTTAATAVATGASDLIIGSDGGASGGVDGILDEFTITSDIITSGEVTTIYNGGSGIPYTAGATSNSNFLTFM